MGRSLWLADVLADAYRGVSGVRFEVYPGWQTRGRDGVRHIGLMNHHTGPGGYDALLRYMATNSSIAPLCNIASSHDGSRVTLVAAGKANHAGRGHLDWTGTDRGNWYTLGWEAQNDGRQPWPDKHLETVAIGNAALRAHMAVDLSRLVDHKTYAPGRKVDRHTIQLDAWRRRVATIGQRKDDDMLTHGQQDPEDTAGPVTAWQHLLNRYLVAARIRFDGDGSTYEQGRMLNPDGNFGDLTVAAGQKVLHHAQTDGPLGHPIYPNAAQVTALTQAFAVDALERLLHPSGSQVTEVPEHDHDYASVSHFHDFQVTTKGATGKARS